MNLVAREEIVQDEEHGLSIIVYSVLVREDRLVLLDKRFEDAYTLLLSLVYKAAKKICMRKFKFLLVFSLLRELDRLSRSQVRKYSHIVDVDNVVANNLYSECIGLNLFSLSQLSRRDVRGHLGGS